MPDSYTTSFPSFLAVALAIEEAAADRYRELAQRMEHNHVQAAVGFFRMMAALEADHAEQVRRQSAGQPLPEPGSVACPWPLDALPESLPDAALRGGLTRVRALQLALEGEIRAQAYFERMARDAADPRIRGVAGEFAREEAEHARKLRHLLEDSGNGQPDWVADHASRGPEPGR